MWKKSTLAGAEDAIATFGRRLREGRHRAGLSQTLLEARSGVDQSLISRLELAKAPHASLERVVRLGQALGPDFPLGYCPHEHKCAYRPDWKPPPWEGHLPYQTRRVPVAPPGVVGDAANADSQDAVGEPGRAQPHGPPADVALPEHEASLSVGLVLSTDGLVTLACNDG